MKARTPLLVGIVLVVAALSLSWFVLTTSKDVYGERKTHVYYADFTDASGIRWKTRVQINGIDIGKIEEVGHESDEYGQLMARVKIRVLKEYRIFTNARVRKTAESLLGDYRLDIVPGGPFDICNRDFDCGKRFTCERHRCLRPCTSAAACKEGQTCTDSACTYLQLEPEAVIPNVEIPATIDEIQNSLNHVVANVDALTESFKRVLSGPEGEGSLKAILDRVERSMEAIEQATSVLSDTITRNDETINQVVDNLGTFSNRLAAASGPDGDLTRLSENLATLSSRVNRIASSVQGVVDGEEWDGGGLRETIDNLNDSISHINEIARKIDQGQGTIGQVVNDPGIAEKVEQTLDDTSELIGGLSRLETQIELRSDYNVPFEPDREGAVEAAIRNTLALRIVPKPDKYYLFEAISDPRGVQTRRITNTTNETGAVVKEEKVETVVTDFGDLKFSAQFAKRYYFLTLRFGIIESTGGVGANMHLIDDQLELRLDAFDFSRRDPDNPDRIFFPRLRTIAMYEFIKHLHLQAGIDDPLNRNLRTWFVGGALSFTDEDLKTLLTVAPTP